MTGASECIRLARGDPPNSNRARQYTVASVSVLRFRLVAARKHHSIVDIEPLGEGDPSSRRGYRLVSRLDTGGMSEPTAVLCGL
jgi:hypothetical protein